ncbi:S-layer homology domain-containing protein [Paenibacillus sp. HB172176]|uniref:S-layer homology domain-containing protein n=1 Tax=Paenibacillus sp. HB172176 TaxID=2493690 RepID=UPI00143C8E46|nr:S-layer homology domain-containing protein [Paenibacillus sp. HB172176]
MKKKMIASCMAALLLGSTASYVSADELTAQEKFNALKAKGIFSGIGDESMGLDQNMTRAQFARVAGLLDGLDVDATPSTQTFRDVAPGNWAYEEVEAAANAGLIVGNGDGTFNPSGDISVEQMSTVLVRVLRIETDDSAKVDGASDWAQKYVKAAINAGLISNGDDFTTPVVQEQVQSSALNTVVVEDQIGDLQQENKEKIGSVLALGVMSAKDQKFNPDEYLTREELIEMTNAILGEDNDSSSEIPENPTFGDILRSMLHATGYPMDELTEENLVSLAIEVGILDEDDVIIKIQPLNAPLKRTYAAGISSDTIFEAKTVTVEDDKVILHEDKKVVDNMTLPKTPIQVKLDDMEDVPFYTSLSDINKTIADIVKQQQPVYSYTDTTVPTITYASINLKPVSINLGKTGTITFDVNDGNLTEGTIEVSENSVLTVTAFEGVDLTNFSSSYLTQQLYASQSNSLNIIDLLAQLDSDHTSGVSLSGLANHDLNDDGILIEGTLKDGAGNTQNISIRINITLAP